MSGCTHVSVFPHFPYISASRVHPHTHAHKRKQTKTNTHAQTNTHKNAPPHAHTDVSVHMLHIALQMFPIYSHTDLLPCRPQNTSNVHKCWRWGGGTDWNMGTSTHMWWTTHHQLHNVAGKKSRKLHMKKGDLSCLVTILRELFELPRIWTYLPCDLEFPIVWLGIALQMFPTYSHTVWLALRQRILAYFEWDTWFWPSTSKPKALWKSVDQGCSTNWLTIS